jgi:hypothetical protein
MKVGNPDLSKAQELINPQPPPTSRTVRIFIRQIAPTGSGAKDPEDTQ